MSEQKQRLWMNLAAMAPDRLDELRDEVARRTELFARRARSVPWKTQPPALSALESVISDVTHGRL